MWTVATKISAFDYGFSPIALQTSSYGSSRMKNSEKNRLEKLLKASSMLISRWRCVCINVIFIHIYEAFGRVKANPEKQGLKLGL